MMAGLVEGHECETCIAQGYEDSRFEVRDPISQSFHCPICMNVLNDPVMCRNNQHYFCRGCITKHLKNTNNCPTCQDELSLETLVKAPRIVIEYLSELRIRCDFFDRGCRDVVQLSGLREHVSMCGFVPMGCSNEGCDVVVNRQDKLHHEAEVCEFRRLQCHDCVELKKEVKHIRENMMEDNANMKKQVDELSEKITEDNAKLQQQIDELSEKTMEDNAKLRKQVDQLSEKTMKDNAKLRKQVDLLSEKIGRMCEMQVEVTDNVTQMMTLLQNLQKMMPGQSLSRRSIIIAGGLDENGKPTNSVEIFNWSQKTWTLQNAMSKRHSRASAVIYKGQIIISGGRIERKSTDTMETSSCDEPLQWDISAVKLPELCQRHAAVMYKDSLLLSGGKIGNAYNDGNKIYAVSVVPPYFSNVFS